jgi:retinol-binding protein 3
MTTLSEATRCNVINTLLVALADNYVFPDKAAKMSDYIQGKLEAGSYSTIDDVHVLAERLKVDMQHVTSDEHIRLRHDPDAFARLKAQDARPDTDDDPNVQIFIERERYDNFGFKRVERLAGNIGYIRLDAFENVEWAGKTAAGAMNFVAECHALIFDLRNNGGGNPTMVQFISSYLFRGSRHLNTWYWRPTDSYNQLWTQAHVQGKKLTDIPVYVLTSVKTLALYGFQGGHSS